MSDRSTKNPLQPSDDPIYKKEVAGSSTTKREIRDFDARARQMADKPESSKDVAESSGDAPYPFTLVEDPLIDNPMLTVAKRENLKIEKGAEKYRDSHTEHLDNSREQILDTIRRARDRARQERPGEPISILFIGTGPNYDTPLAEAVKLCDGDHDRITLAEIDKESAMNAITTLLSRDEQRKVKLVITDMTGIGSKYRQRMLESIDGLVSSKKPLKDFYEPAEEITAAMLDETPKIYSEVGNNHDCVISHLVGSQVTFPQRKYIEAAIIGKFHVSKRDAKNVLSTWESFFEKHDGNFDKLKQKMRKEHYQIIADLLNDSGDVFIADTINSKHITPAMPGGFVMPILSKEVTDSIREHFSVLEEHNWNYLALPGELGYDIAAYSGVKKSLAQPSVEAGESAVEGEPAVPKKKKKKKKKKMGSSALSEQAGVKTSPDVPQQEVKEGDGKSKRRAEKEDTIGEREKSSSPPPEPSGVQMPPDGKEQMRKILEDPSGRERLKGIFQEEDTGGKGQELLSSKRSGVETPPEVRQQIKELQHPSGRERLKELLMMTREEEDIDRLGVEDLRILAKDYRKENEDLKRSNSELQGQVNQLTQSLTEATRRAVEKE